MATIRQTKIMFILFFLIHLSCVQVNQDREEVKQSSAIVDSIMTLDNQRKKKETDHKHDTIKIDNTIGLVVFNENAGDKPLFKIYNQDKTLWYSFAFEPNIKVNPFAWHRDYYLLVFRCVKKEKGWYQIIVNEKTKEVKYIS